MDLFIKWSEDRHYERSEAIHGKGSDDQLDCFGAKLLAMTTK
jgi:hypothetical protein